MNKNKLFKPAKNSEWWKNAIIGGSFKSSYGYAMGYKVAGDILVDKALEGYLPNALVVPLCFCYRHFVELSLKELICYTERLLRLCVDCGESIIIDRDRTMEEIQKKLEETHSIECLIQWLKDTLQKVSCEPFDEMILGYLIEIHNIDPDSQTFRYVRNKKREAFLKNQEHYDLENIKVQITKIEQYFSGIDGWLAEQVDVAEDYISDTSESVEGEYS